MAIFRITEENGETYDVPANWESDDFVVAMSNNGELKMYGLQNNLDDAPSPSGRYVNEEEGLYEGDLPDNVELIVDEDD